MSVTWNKIKLPSSFIWNFGTVLCFQLLLKTVSTLTVMVKYSSWSWIKVKCHGCISGDVMISFCPYLILGFPSKNCNPSSAEEWQKFSCFPRIRVRTQCEVEKHERKIGRTFLFIPKIWWWIVVVQHSERRRWFLWNWKTLSNRLQSSVERCLYQIWQGKIKCY